MGTVAVYATTMHPLACGGFRVEAGCCERGGPPDGRGFTDALLLLYRRCANVGPMTDSPSMGQGPTACRPYPKAGLEPYWQVKQPPIICAPAIVALLSALLVCVGLLASADPVLANPIVRLPSASAKALGYPAGDDKRGCSLGTDDTAVVASGRLRLRHDLVGPLRCPVASRSEAVDAYETGGAAPFRTNTATG